MKLIYCLIILYNSIILTWSFNLKMQNLPNEKKLCNKNKCLIDNKKLYVKALVYSRKSKKILNNISQSKTETIERFINDSLNIINDIDINKKIDNLNNTYINNQDTNIKNIIIGDTIYLDIKDVKMIKITTNNDDIKIELDKNKKLPLKSIYNDFDEILKNIKELDTLLNFLNIILFFQK